VIALLAALFVVLAVPITRTHAGVPAPRPVDAEARTEEALAQVLRRQAQRVSAIVAPAGPAAASPADLTTTGHLATALIPDPLLSAVARLAAGGALDGDEPSPLAVPLNSSAASFTLHENGLSSTQVTQYRTVGDALAGAGIDIGPPDIVRPAPESQLSPGMHVYVDYATDVRLLLGDDDDLVATQAPTVGAMLKEQGIEIEATDRVFPALETAVRQAMIVSLTLIRDVIVHEDKPIAHTAVLQYDYSLPVGQKVIVQSGADGAVRRSYKVHMVNNEEVSRVLLGEETIPPTNQIVRLGAKTSTETLANGAAPPGEGDCVSRMNVWATYYTAASAGGYGITRTGTGVYKGIIATDPGVIPLGTRMYIPGYGYGVAADTGGGVIGAHIDLAYGVGDVLDWGSRHVEICILN
jgi:3D (Asp-Asp-Asp) domain-containing protein